MSRGRLRLFLVFVLLSATDAVAHEIRPAIVQIDFADDAGYRLEIVLNAEAVLAGIGPQHRDTRDAPQAEQYDALRRLAPDALRPRIEGVAGQFAAQIGLRFDGGAPLSPELVEVDVPEVGDLARARRTRMVFTGKVPPGASQVEWQYPEAYGSAVLKWRRAGDAEYMSTWLRPGVASEPLTLAGSTATPSRSDTPRRYLTLGFTHIVPKGLDHILFVLGLFLLSLQWRPLLWQVTAFTLAHSITLGLSIYGVFSLSPGIVEPLIALSIVYVAVENLLTPALKPWRVVIVFAFGLLHGLGFADVLHELGLPRSEFLTALVAFNVGVECGQLTVITAAFAMVGFLRDDPARYRRAVVIPGSLIIAVVGAYWTIERTWAGWLA